MKTASEHHEKKTKVVTFRVANQIYDQIEDTKAKTGLSNADLIMRGAGICEEEIKAKLAELSGLDRRLAQLKVAIRQTQQELDRVIAQERKRRLAELDTEIEVFKLFDQGWTLVAVSFKMGIPRETAYRYFQEWGDVRNNKQAIEQELLRECLTKHLDVLKQQRNWGGLPPGYPEYLEKVQEEIDCYEYLLQSPSEIDDVRKAFLLTEYSSQIHPAKTKGKVVKSTSCNILGLKSGLPRLPPGHFSSRSDKLGASTQTTDGGVSITRSDTASPSYSVLVWRTMRL